MNLAKKLFEELYEMGAESNPTRFKDFYAGYKEAATSGLVAVGTVLLGDTDGEEIDDWDVEWNRATVDAINETRPKAVSKLTLFMETNVKVAPVGTAQAKEMMNEREKTIALEVAFEVWNAGGMFVGPPSIIEFASRFLARIREEQEPALSASPCGLPG
jgi:hypothetical protein